MKFLYTNLELGAVFFDSQCICLCCSIISSLKQLYVVLEFLYRCNEWLKLVGREDLIGKNVSNCKICSLHFQVSDFYTLQIKKLLPTALPSSAIPTSSPKRKV